MKHGERLEKLADFSSRGPIHEITLGVELASCATIVVETSGQHRFPLLQRTAKTAGTLEARTDVQADAISCVG